MAGIRGGHDPLVMRLVKLLIYGWMVQSTVNQVDPEIGKYEERRELEPHIALSVVVNVLVELRVPTDLQQKTGCGEDGHHRERPHGLRNFLPDLVFEKLRVLEGVFVEDEHVGERREDEIYNEAENPTMGLRLVDCETITMVVIGGIVNTMSLRTETLPVVANRFVAIARGRHIVRAGSPCTPIRYHSLPEH